MTSPEALTPDTKKPNAPIIDYELLVAAKQYYDNQGFTHIYNPPWVVSPENAKLTAPEGATLFPVKGEGMLVASGEQSFLQMLTDASYSNCFPKHGRYSCITPCFRDDKRDELHYRYFMKLELMDHHEPTRIRLYEIMTICLQFFSMRVQSEIIDTDAFKSDPLSLPNTTYDIVTKNTGVELGSYGIREHPTVGRWIYATGCAEPRLSSQIRKEQGYEAFY